MLSKQELLDIAKEVVIRGPERVVVNASGLAVPPRFGKERYNVSYDVLFVRGDGWSLGAPKALESVALSIWRPESPDGFVLKLEKGKSPKWLVDIDKLEVERLEQERKEHERCKAMN